MEVAGHGEGSHHGEGRDGVVDEGRDAILTGDELPLREHHQGGQPGLRAAGERLLELVLEASCASLLFWFQEEHRAPCPVEARAPVLADVVAQANERLGERPVPQGARAVGVALPGGRGHELFAVEERDDEAHRAGERDEDHRPPCARAEQVPGGRAPHDVPARCS